MGFIAICTAIYDYQPQAEGELEIHEGELLFILEKGSDDWWKAKKKAADEEADEPEGLIPNNYVEEAKAVHTARALYEYIRQTEEEISFPEDAALDVYDDSDPEWTLVGLDGEYGFAPANYIEISAGTPTASQSAAAVEPSAPVVESPASPAHSSPTLAQGPAANLARVLGGGAVASPATARAVSSPHPARPQYTPEASDGEAEEPAPALPRRPPSQSLSEPSSQPTTARDTEPPGVLPSPPYNRALHPKADEDEPVPAHQGFHLYHVNEMVSAMGKRKKMPTMLGLNTATGTVMLSPAKSKDGPTQEWTAEKMSHYSIEGKHVFIELVRPSKSLDLHAGAKDTAQEIVAALGEMAGAVRGEGLREVYAAAAVGSGPKSGTVLYDFMAQSDDEVTVAVGDDVIILDDVSSKEWWMVRRLKNGSEGVVPSSYIEVISGGSSEPSSRSGLNAGRSTVEQNRMEEERLAKQAVRNRPDRDEDDKQTQRGIEVGPGMKLPQRGSSLAEDDQRRSPKRDKRSNRSDGKSSKSKPDPSKVRTWTDHSGSFKVEAQFVGVADGKIHLHKLNGVRIAVPISKMSADDLAYVEKSTGDNMDEHLPLRVIQDRVRQRPGASDSRGTAGASVEQPKVPEYDWFDFFLKAGVGPQLCERYSQNMIRDSMDESVLPDITSENLRTLGLKEGDILKVMKYLDQKYGRTKRNDVNGANGDAGGGLFSGPGGALHNNTRRIRPDSKRQVSDVVDPTAFVSKDDKHSGAPADKAASVSAPVREQIEQGFDDNAWDVKLSKPQDSTPQQVSRLPVQESQTAPTGVMAELSLLETPLQPTKAPTNPASVSSQAINTTSLGSGQAVNQAAPTMAPQQQAQPTGANPSFFQQLGQSQPQAPQRQRPQPPQQNFNNSLLPPPRPLSAPQNFPQNSQFGPPPLQPQLTGIPHNAPLQAPPGQSLSELNQQRLQQQFQLQNQSTGFAPYGQGLLPQQTAFQPQQPQYGGFQQQPYLNGNAAGSPFADPRPAFQPQPTGFQPQPTGFQPQPTGFPQPQFPPGGINSILPPALQPQKTAFNIVQPQQQTNGYQQQGQPPSQPPQINGFAQQQQPAQSLQPQMTSFIPPQPTGYGQTLQQNGFGTFSVPPLPPIPQQPPSIAPLQPQRTGPAPPVRFGVAPEPKKLIAQPTGRRANLSHATPQNPFGF